MSLNHYDIIIIGTGAGGGTLAYALADWGKKILLLERGDFLPKSTDNWSPEAVFDQALYKAKEKWLDQQDRPFSPGMNYYVGGKHQSLRRGPGADAAGGFWGVETCGGHLPGLAGDL